MVKIQRCFGPAVLLVGMMIAGCGGGPAGTGHKDDPTPGAAATPPAEELMDPAKFDDYAKEQAKKAQK